MNDTCCQCAGVNHSDTLCFTLGGDVEEAAKFEEEHPPILSR